MARPRSQPATSHQSTDLSKLSSEVLWLRLQQMNLPVTGNHACLVERLCSANGTRQLSATARNKRADGRVAKRSSTSSKRSQQAARSLNRQSATSNLASEPHDLDPVLDHFPEEESATSDLLVALNAEPMESMESSDAVFTPAQLAAIQDTVSSTVQAAFQLLPHNDVILPAPAFFSTPSPRASSVAPPNGFNRPLDKALAEKILRGEYVDVSLLLPETLYQTQTPALQLRYEDSPPGYLGSLLTVVKRKKPVVDSFQKWLDAFMAYMLVIVTAYPNRAVELIKYQQIISRAVTKFKGLAWYTYDEHFRRRVARNLTIAWDRIDIELWTVTFTGTAKPHCSICSSPYHQSDDCPHQEPSKKPRRSALVCFDFNKPASYLSLPPQLTPLWIQQSCTLQLPQLQTACHKHQISNPGRSQQKIKWNSASGSRDQQCPPLSM